MRAIILNSGIGKRMGELTRDMPKCMVELGGGETILSRQIDYLLKNGINKIIITTGPFAEKLQNYVTELYRKSPANFTFVHNPLYETTNYIYSLHLAAPHSDDDILLMHGDLVFEDAGPLKLLSAVEKDAVLVDTAEELPEKDFKCRIADGLVKEIGVDVFGPDCRFLFPMYKLSAGFYRQWLDRIALFVEAGNTVVYAENALNEILPELPLYPIYYTNDFCAEVDDTTDLDVALKKLYGKGD